MKWWLAALALREFFAGRGAGIGRDLKTLERHRASVRATRSRGGIISNELSDLERQTLHAAEQRWYGAAIARTGSRPGVAKLLERLAVRRIPQVVISDFEAAYKLDALGLGDYFNTTYCGDSLGFVKPSPRLFEQAAADFGIEPHQLLHIGDRADTDDVAAVTAGCQCLVLGRDFPNFDALADELAAPPARFKT